MKYCSLPRCEYCLRKMPSKYILCIHCNVELCIKCFSFGVEGGNHRKTHKYKIEDAESKVEDIILKKNSKWNYDEELELLNAVGVYKSGNWVDISSMVRTKSPEECRKHFVENYIDGEFGRKIISDLSLFVSSTKAAPFYDHTGGISSPLFHDHYPPSLMNIDEEKCLGYFSRRNDFILEYDDCAEKLICSINSENNFTSLISAINMNLIDMYNWRLSRRNYRKRVALEHGLVYHLMARILDKSPRDYNYFNRQLLKRTQSSIPNGQFGRHKSLFGRSYVSRQRSFVQEQSTDYSSSCAPSTPSDIDLVSPTPASSTSQFNSSDSKEVAQEERPYWHYNPTLIDERLRPFLRYMSSEDTKQLLESMKVEETLRTEISSLQVCVRHGIADYQDYKAKLAALHQHKDQQPAKCRKPLKRKRGRQRCFQFVYMERKKRMTKYLESLKNVSSMTP